MKRTLIQFLIVALVCSVPLSVGAGITSLIQKAAAGGDVYDDFNRASLGTNWTNLDGGPWSIISNELAGVSPDADGVYLWYQEMDSVDHWAAVTVSGDHLGVYLRSTNNVAEYAYGYRKNANDQSLATWRWCLGAICTDIGDSYLIYYDSGHCLRAEVTGTGTSTRLGVWREITGPCPARSEWTQWPDLYIIDNPLNEANTGKYVGLYSGATTSKEWDDFRAGSAPTSHPLIEDNFTYNMTLSDRWSYLGTTSGWSVDWDSASRGRLSANGSTAGVMLYSPVQTTTISQWAMVKNVAGEDYGGLYLRSTNNSSEYAYSVRWEDTLTDVVWRECLVDSCVDIERSTTIAIAQDDYLGVEITGTGDDTVVKVWDLGATPPDHGSWGTADATFTNNPTVSKRADTGKYLGLYQGSGGSVFDDFKGGDI